MSKITKPYLLNGTKLIPLTLATKSLDAPKSTVIDKTDSGYVYPQFYNPTYYQNLVGINDMLDTAIYTLVEDTVVDISVDYNDINWREDGIEPLEVESAKAKSKQRIMDMDIVNTLQRGMYDYITCGYMTMEVTRDSASKVIGINHIPAAEMQLTMQADKKVWRQRAYGQQVYYVPYGSDYAVDYRTGTVLSSAPLPGAENKANEVYIINNYTHYDSIYGKPIYANDALISRVKQATLHNAVNEQMLQSYNTKPYVVLLTGDYASSTFVDIETGREDALVDKIKDIVDGREDNLVMSLPGEDINVEIIQLDRYNTESSGDVNKEVNTSILSTLRIPEQRILAVPYTAQGGLNSNAESTQLKAYQQRLQNMAKRLSQMLNQLLDDANYNYNIVTYRYAVDDDPTQILAELQMLINNGAITPAEARQVYVDKYNLSDIDNGYAAHLDTLFISQQAVAKQVDSATKSKRLWFKRQK